MMNWIWCGMMLCSFVYGGATGTLQQTVAGCWSGTEEAVKLILTMSGIMMFWSGLLKIAETSGMLACLERWMAPVTKRLFPGIPPTSDTMKKICANMTANLFGLGNAATPFGISAIKSMKAYMRDSDTATEEMSRFVLLNTASVQLIPSTMIALRTANGSLSPASIIPLCWVSSAAALFAGLFAFGVMTRKRRRR